MILYHLSLNVVFVWRYDKIDKKGTWGIESGLVCYMHAQGIYSVAIAKKGKLLATTSPVVFYMHAQGIYDLLQCAEKLKNSNVDAPA